MDYTDLLRWFYAGSGKWMRNLKWPLAILHWLFDQAMVQAFLVYKLAWQAKFPDADTDAALRKKGMLSRIWFQVSVAQSLGRPIRHVAVVAAAAAGSPRKKARLKMPKREKGFKPGSTLPPLRLEGPHPILMHVESETVKSAGRVAGKKCKWCMREGVTTAGGFPVMSVFMCCSKDCKVTLCVPDCWNAWHGLM